MTASPPTCFARCWKDSIADRKVHSQASLSDRPTPFVCFLLWNTPKLFSTAGWALSAKKNCTPWLSCAFASDAFMASAMGHMFLVSRASDSGDERIPATRSVAIAARPKESRCVLMVSPSLAMRASIARPRFERLGPEALDLDHELAAADVRPDQERRRGGVQPRADLPGDILPSRRIADIHLDSGRHARAAARAVQFREIVERLVDLRRQVAVVARLVPDDARGARPDQFTAAEAHGTGERGRARPVFPRVAVRTQLPGILDRRPRLACRKPAQLHAPGGARPAHRGGGRQPFRRQSAESPRAPDAELPVALLVAVAVVD